MGRSNKEAREIWLLLFDYDGKAHETFATLKNSLKQPQEHPQNFKVARF